MPTKATEVHRNDSRANSPLATIAYDRVRKAILQGEFRPNQRLIEADLAEWLQLSRTPLREGLNRLSLDPPMSWVTLARLA